MNNDIFALTEQIVSRSYANQGLQSRRQREKQIKALISNRRIPKQGWDSVSIELFLSEIASMDSNNFTDNVGVGEREARVFSDLVSKRNFRLGHGIGRSGDIVAVQPKAAGSSLLNKVTNYMTLSVLRIGIPETADCLVLPMATGMGILLTLIALKSYLPKQEAKRRYVIWPRIDQKTCLKSIVSAGLEPVIVENLIEGDELRTDVPAVEAKIAELGAENVLCVFTTSSCFAPRAPDRVVEIARLCKKLNVAHLINNAYGLQAEDTTAMLSKAHRVGRVDAFVQSTDKNFMVPVGGSVVASSDAEFIKATAKTYPGRASSSPLIDLFITFLSMGETKYRELCKERADFVPYFKEKLRVLAESHGERLLETPNNPISFGITLDTFSSQESDSKRDCSYLGSMLFQRWCSGLRTVPKHAKKEVGGFHFTGYGAHHDTYPHAYMVCASAMGVTKRDIDEFILRLDKAMKKFRSVIEKEKAKSATKDNASGQLRDQDNSDAPGP